VWTKLVVSNNDIIYSDYRSICPFCDRPLPEFPSDKLSKLIDKAKENSTPGHRDNPLALDAPLNITIDLCLLHVHEAEMVPLADERGWPMIIDYVDVLKRLQQDPVVSCLKEIYAQPANSKFYVTLLDRWSKGGDAAISNMGMYLSLDQYGTG
jgi:hypothetical protein